MEKKRYPQFYMLGDSIIEQSSNLVDGFSFVACLQQHCARRLDVINRGLSGYNTDTLSAIFDHLVPPTSCAKIDYLLLLLGANDSCPPTGQTKQHVPLERYTASIRNFITHPLVAAHAPTILLCTAPPIDEAQTLPGERSARNAASYVEAIRSIALSCQAQEREDPRAPKVVLVDLWKGIMDEALKLSPSFKDNGLVLGSKGAGDSTALAKFLRDGIHLSGQGYRIFWDLVKKEVGRGWENEPSDDPTWIWPHWTVALKNLGVTGAMWKVD